MVSDCLSLRYVGEEDCLEVERFLYGGAAVAIIRCKTWPIVVTVAAGSEAETSSPETPLSYVTKSISWSPEAVEVLERKGKIGAKRPLTEAKIIVGVGRGLKCKGRFGAYRAASECHWRRGGLYPPLSGRTTLAAGELLYWSFRRAGKA